LQRHITYLVLLFLAVMLFQGCKEQKKSANSEPMAMELYRPGDIVFRTGLSGASLMITGFDTKGIYSHVGIVCLDSDSNLCVAHAVPDELESEDDVDKVKLCSIGTFYSKDRAAAGGVFRLDESRFPDSVPQQAARLAYEMTKRNILFDSGFDDADTTRMYCTEFVVLVYNKLNTDLKEGRSTPMQVPGFAAKVVLPSDLEECGKLKKIYSFIY